MVMQAGQTWTKRQGKVCRETNLKVSFVSHSTKDLKHMSPGKPWVLHTFFLENELKTSEKKYRAMFFYSIEDHMQKFRHF